MKKIYTAIENYWFQLPQQLRYLIVGGANTLLAYIIFVILIMVIELPYQTGLIIQYIMTVNISIFSMRYYVFRSQGNWKKEYIKAWHVYLLMLGINYLFLWIVIDTLHYNILLSQAVYTVLSIIVSYLLHRFYSFH